MAPGVYDRQSGWEGHMVYWYWFDYIYYTLLEYIVVTGQDVVHMANIIIMTFYDIGHDTYVVSGLSPLSPSTII